MYFLTFNSCRYIITWIYILTCYFDITNIAMNGKVSYADHQSLIGLPINSFPELLGIKSLFGWIGQSYYL